MPAPPVHRVTAEARGKLRQVKQELVILYSRLEREFPKLQTLAADFVARGSVKGRVRAFTKLDRLLSRHAALCDLNLEPPAPLALWAALKPRGAVLLNSEDPGQQQDCIAVNYLMVGAVKGPNSAGWADGLWTLEVSDHALHQLIIRAPGVRVAETLLLAHQAALMLPVSQFIQEYVDPVMLRAPLGVFICEWLGGHDPSIDGTAIHLRARTWLHSDQLRDDQQPFHDGAPGDRLGEGHLRPTPLAGLGG
jgi:hypothetical protein